MNSNIVNVASKIIAIQQLSWQLFMTDKFHMKCSQSQSALNIYSKKNLFSLLSLHTYEDSLITGCSSNLLISCKASEQRFCVSKTSGHQPDVFCLMISSGHWEVTVTDFTFQENQRLSRKFQSYRVSLRVLT